MIFDRSYRFGKPSRFKQPRHVWDKIQTAPNTAIGELKRPHLGVGVQLPKEWPEARKTLDQVMQKEKSNSKNVKIIDGQKHKVHQNCA